MWDPGERNITSAQQGAARARRRSPEHLAHLGLRHNVWMRGDQKEKVLALGMGGWLGVHLWVLDRLGETGVLFRTFPGHCQQGASRGPR